MPEWINIELTSNCNKSCNFCGRAKARAEGLKTGNMEIGLFKHILTQYHGTIIQFNKDGEPLMYPYLKEVGELCRNYTTNIVTNGKLLVERSMDIINNFTTITVSVIEDDKEQYNAIANFVNFIDNRLPKVYIKFLGDYDNPDFEKMGLKTMRRSIHHPFNDNGYLQSKPPMPELGICLDFLMKPAIDWQGKVHICNRYDPNDLGVIGDCSRQSLNDIFSNALYHKWKTNHEQGERTKVPLCNTCEFWGIPTS